MSNNIRTSDFGVTDGARTHDNRNHNPGLYQLRYGHHIHCSTSNYAQHHFIILARLAWNSESMQGLSGAPDRTRTCNLRLRRPLLYPVELRAPGSPVAPTNWSGQRDLNPRLPAPKAGALPDCAMPRFDKQATGPDSTGNCLQGRLRMTSAGTK